jgi:hypothetical protein
LFLEDESDKEEDIVEKVIEKEDVKEGDY